MGECVVCRAQDPQIIDGISASISNVLDMVNVEKASGSASRAVRPSIGAAVSVA